MASLRAAGLSAEEALSALAQLSDLPSRLVLDQILEAFSFVRDKLLEDAQDESYRAQLSRLLRPRFERLGLFPSGPVSGDEKLLRARVVRVLALEAKDPALLGELARLGRALLGVAEHPRLPELPSELFEPALSAALRTGDEALLERAIDKLVQENDGTVRGRALGRGERARPAGAQPARAVAQPGRTPARQRTPVAAVRTARTTRDARARLRVSQAELRAAFGGAR